MSCFHHVEQEAVPLVRKPSNTLEEEEEKEKPAVVLWNLRDFCQCSLSIPVLPTPLISQTPDTGFLGSCCQPQLMGIYF